MKERVSLWRFKLFYVLFFEEFVSPKFAGVQSTMEKPRFVTPLSNAMGRAGQRVKLECEARGSPMPTLTWYHDGRPIEESMNLKVIFFIIFHIGKKLKSYM